MSKALVVYATRNGETRKIGEIIAEGLRFSGCQATLEDVKQIKRAEELLGFDIYVFGSSTYHGQMTNNMKSFLFLAEQAELAGKVGGAFGSYGWSGEAAERIFDTMHNIFRMDMVSSPLMLKTIGVEGGLKMAQEYGRELAGKVSGS